ncbi:conserved hypothetical protein [Desulfosarcina cetonica]|uniref:DUF3795 domain-containing protein n=1 Tax=Desulfosarcina cetonica TaxID=90730 RepID=UPI0006D00C21|nr:DUF3795 domain-containing protein [Desulfosarcina cetonica]VTR66203.1 conserved hypothetical protein [Desulfosarcina cetonica]
MTNETIKHALAPCGLSCETCFAHVDGGIRRASQALKEKLGNFGPYAAFFENLMREPVFANYPAFQAMLDYLAEGHCTGCRNEQCRMFKECGVRPCHQEKQVDFCYQCTDFPCEQTNFSKPLYRTWVRVNEKIREEGLAAYYAATQILSRYP